MANDADFLFGLDPLDAIAGAPFAAPIPTIKRSGVISFNNADIVAGTTKTIVAGVGGKVLIPVRMYTHYDGHLNDAGYNTSRAAIVRWNGIAGTDLIDTGNTAFPNTQIEKYDFQLPPVSINLSSAVVGNPVAVSPVALDLICGPNGNNIYLGLTPVTTMHMVIDYLELPSSIF